MVLDRQYAENIFPLIKGLKACGGGDLFEIATGIGPIGIITDLSGKFIIIDGSYTNEFIKVADDLMNEVVEIRGTIKNVDKVSDDGLHVMQFHTPEYDYMFTCPDYKDYIGVAVKIKVTRKGEVVYVQD